VKINYLHYWSDSLRDPEVEGRQVPVRYDPFDAGTAYAFVKGRWVRCISQHHALFNGRSERELMLATEGLRSRYRGHGRRAIVTARQLGQFLGSLEAEERLLPQRRRDAAMRRVLQVVQVGRTAEDPSMPTIMAAAPPPSTPAGLDSTAVPAAGRQATAGAVEVLTPYDDSWK
jgi:putative transposase